MEAETDEFDDILKLLLKMSKNSLQWTWWLHHTETINLFDGLGVVLFHAYHFLWGKYRKIDMFKRIGILVWKMMSNNNYNI